MKLLKLNLRNSLLAFGLLAMVACGNDDTDEVTYTPEQEAAQIDALIENLTNNDLDVDTTAAGVYYVMHEEGDGSYVQPGDSIGISYIAYFTDGTVFDSSASQQDGVWRYVSGEVPLIAGFTDAVNQLREGGFGTFIIPSALGYGPSGYYTIPPYTPLVFDIELVAIYSDETTL